MWGCRDTIRNISKSLPSRRFGISNRTDVEFNVPAGHRAPQAVTEHVKGVKMGAVRNRKPDYKRGTRKDIIEILHMTGVIPAKALDLVNVPRTYKQKIKDMEREGIIGQARVKNYGHVRLVYFMNPYDEISSAFSSDLREGYYEFYSTYGTLARKNCLRGEASRSVRAIQNAEAYMFMHSAGLACDLCERPNLVAEKHLDMKNAYYMSYDFKNAAQYEDKVTGNQKGGIREIMGSRVIGLAATQGGIYSVFVQTGDAVKWQAGAEIRMRIHIDAMLAKKMEFPKKPCGLIISDDYESLSRLVDPAIELRYKAKAAVHQLEESYEKVYALPLTADGKKLFEVMSRPGWERIIREASFGRQAAQAGQMAVDCDLYENGTYTLNFCAPDIMRLRRFLAYASSDTEHRYRITCFDFQKGMLEKASHGSCEIKSGPFEKFLKIIEPAVGKIR